jgi:NADH dehydrogenase [ubiquinone] 1 alpha subcomplex assembly factor 7
MTPLDRRIAALISAEGPISMAQFMTLALLDPVNGYYATRDPFGAAGDFITAPEVSQMFGELLGLWLAQAWQDQGRPARPRLVELGPGRGTLMRDALRALKLVPEFVSALEVVLVEASPVLQKAQAELLKDTGAPVRWAASFDAAAPDDRPLFLIANEFFDALPIRQYVMSERGWCERMVAADAEGAPISVLAPAPATHIPANRGTAPPGGAYEVRAAGEALVEEISHRIAASGGAALIIDYGYDTPGFGETLQAVAKHSYADVLHDAGMNDLSAHVDFRALAAAGQHGGAAVHGPVGQGAFLRVLGIEARAAKLGQADALHRLVAPEQMGALFKALALVPKSAPTPPGF